MARDEMKHVQLSGYDEFSSRAAACENALGGIVIQELAWIYIKTLFASFGAEEIIPAFVFGVARRGLFVNLHAADQVDGAHKKSLPSLDRD
jgi:hypothetical protein